MRCFIGGLMTETNTFSPFPTGIEDFHRVDGERKLLAAWMGSMLDVFRNGAEELGWEVIQGLGAGAMPGGRTTRRAYEALKAELLGDLERAHPVDVVLLQLHGAMVAEGYDDCEGDILQAVRRIVGPDVPIGVEIDPHCNLSPAMVDNADILVCYKEWPHVDPLERAVEVVELTAAVVEGGIKPHIAVWDCRMIDCYHTMDQPVKGLLDDIRSMEGKDGILSISIIHGYPFGDVPDAGTKMMVITDDRPDHGARLAEDLGRRLFAMRGHTRAAHLGLDEGLDAIEAAEGRPVVVADTADAPGAGSPGDGTYIIRGLLDRGVEDVAVAYIWDPVATSVAMSAGEGSVFALRIGGKMGPMSGDPLDLEVEIVKVAPDLVVPAGEGRGEQPVGDVAVVRSRGIEIALTKDRPVAMHSDHFRALGIDPQDRRVLLVKSVNNFRAGFESVAGEFVYISGPGALDTSLVTHDFQRIQRPKWPFDEEPFV